MIADARRLLNTDDVDTTTLRFRCWCDINLKSFCRRQRVAQAIDAIAFRAYVAAHPDGAGDDDGSRLRRLATMSPPAFH